MILVLCIALLAGCSSIGQVVKDLPSDVAGVTTAVGVTALGAAAPVAVVAGIASSVVVETVVEDNNNDIQISEVTNVHQEEVAKTSLWTEAIKSLGAYGIVGAIAAFIASMLVPWIIGRLTPRRSEIRLQERERMAKTQGRLM